MQIKGTLESVDQFLNFKLNNIKVLDEERFPYMMSVKNCFIRGSVIRLVGLPEEAIDKELLHDATRKEAALVIEQSRKALATKSVESDEKKSKAQGEDEE